MGSNKKKFRQSIRRIPANPSHEYLDALRAAFFLDDPLTEEERAIARKYDAQETDRYLALLEQAAKG